jgi:hypothetical protein
MKELLKIYKFYYIPAITVLVINFILFYFLGSYFEAYEGAISSFVHGTYANPCTSYFDINNHFITMSIYEYITPFFPEIQVYGVMMYVYNFLILTLLGMLLYRILKINVCSKILFIYLFIYLFISIDNIINLSSTRISILISVGIFCYIESNRLELKYISKVKRIIMLFVFVFACLMRPEAVLLTSLLYTFIIIIFKRFYIKSLTFISISVLIFMTFIIVINNFSSEAKQVFIFKEKEILDKNNFKTSGLEDGVNLDLMAFIQYGITDKEHFTLKFYDEISKFTAKNGFSSILEFIKNRTYLNTLKHTVDESKSAWYYVAFFILTALLFIKNKTRIRNQFIIYFFFILLVPFVVCVNTIVPLRFLIPYFSVMSCINIILYLYYNDLDIKLRILFLVVLLLMLFSSFQQRKKYLHADVIYNKTVRNLIALNNITNLKTPIIINIIDYEKYFPVNPLQKVDKQNALFLNFFYHGAYDFYIKSWKDVCHCNTFSIKEKMDYIVAKKNLFLISDDAFDFMKLYFEKKYQLHLYKSEVSKFDDELNVCTVHYAEFEN